MTSFRLRQLILLLAAFAMAAGSLLVAGSALADLQLFRVQQSWHNKPNPPVTTAGGAGKYEAWIQPYLTKSYPGGPGKEYLYPPGVATVEPGNNVGSPFTLPTASFLDLVGTYTITPKTGWEGYTTRSYLSYYNGPVRVGPNHGLTHPTRLVFPTTGNNAYPNYGTGNPVNATTTFDGDYDFERVGEINVTPGPNRFGGTYRMFHGPNNSTFYQYIYLFTPAIYRAYGQYQCMQFGEFGCTKDTFSSDKAGTTSIYLFTRFLLNVKGSGTGDRLQSKSAKATTPYPNGAYPTVNGEGTPTSYGPASFITGKQRYLNLVHPWTTGFVSAKNPVGSPSIITPQLQGYDIDLFGAEKITVTRTEWDQVWNKTALSPCAEETCGALTTETTTSKNYMYGVGRVVSLVRPRLIWTYTVPIQGSTNPITQTWPVARLWNLKVWFLPEPTGMALLGTGIVALLGLARIRRR